jgi:hypothetical protein
VAETVFFEIFLTKKYLPRQKPAMIKTRPCGLGVLQGKELRGRALLRNRRLKKPFIDNGGRLCRMISDTPKAK